MAVSERWVELTARFDYKVPGSRTVVSFGTIGKRYFMTKAQAEQAIAEGKGKPSPKVESE